MPDLLERLLPTVVVVGAIGLTVLLLYMVSGPWWPTVIFQLTQRPKVVRWRLAISLALSLVIGNLIANEAGTGAAFVLWVILAPRFIAPSVSRRAWLDDGDGDLRQRAAKVRNRIRERWSEPALDASRPWPQYVIDAAKAERERAFQEQFEANSRSR